MSDTIFAKIIRKEIPSKIAYWPHHPEAFEKMRYEMGAYLGGGAAK